MFLPQFFHEFFQLTPPTNSEYKNYSQRDLQANLYVFHIYLNQGGEFS